MGDTLSFAVLLLTCRRFGPLHLHANICVGKDRRTWQDLECYLFSEMLICVKEKRVTSMRDGTRSDASVSKCNLKGSILIKKHLRQVAASQGLSDEGPFSGN